MAVIFKIFRCGKSNSASSINLPLLGISAVSLTAIAWLHAPISSKALPRSPSQLINSDTLLVQEISNSLQKNVSAPAIAKLVTVRIMTNSGMGSGVIIQHKGQTYTVLTCAHVVVDSEDNRYTILTVDGRTHTGEWLRSTQFPNADLALVQFTSKQAYQVAAIADSKIAIGDSVYAAGFPNWQWINSNDVQDTRNWGTKAFQLTSGKVAMLPKTSLKEGYQLGYTNEILPGMSGGPVLDRYGRLIGINGRLKYPPQGIGSFVFIDGTVPSEELYQQMEALSWAIPTTKFQPALKLE